jgi:hypothetical protein
MAGMIPSFITGANARVSAGGKTFAYASDVSYSVSIDTVPIETMGRYEAVSNEPVNYSVGGELSIVRYTKLATTNPSVTGTQVPPKGTVATGNGLGQITTTNGDNMSNQINPGNILLSMTWDLNVYQKTVNTTPDSNEVAFITITDCRFNRMSAGINKRGILVDRLSFVGILMQDDSFAATSSGDLDLSTG